MRVGTRAKVFQPLCATFMSLFARRARQISRYENAAILMLGYLPREKESIARAIPVGRFKTERLESLGAFQLFLLFLDSFLSNTLSLVEISLAHNKKKRVSDYAGGDVLISGIFISFEIAVFILPRLALRNSRNSL